MTYVSHERAMMAAARVAEALELPGFKPTAVANTNNRHLMKACLEQKGIPTLQFKLVSSYREFIEFITEYKQAIIKPSFGSTGSLGVELTTINDRKNNIVFIKAQQESGNGKVIVETYYPGQEYSVDGYVGNEGEVTVLSVANKFTLGSNNNFVIKGFALGKSTACVASSNEKIMKEIIELSSRTVTSLEINNSFFSLDIIDGENGLMVIDAGLLMDAKIDRLLFFAGLDVYTLRCLLAIGKYTHKRMEWNCKNRGYALRFLYANSEGIIWQHCNSNLHSSIANHGNSRIAIEWERQNGDYVRPPLSLSDTIGWIMVESSDRSTAWKIASEFTTDKCFSLIQG